MAEDLEARFWSNVDRRGPDECWPWLLVIHPDGYGCFRLVKGKPMKLAHRVAFLLTHGHWPEPCCLHSCPDGDNPACCNPAHLREGTNQDNVRDREMRGRGEHNKKRGMANGAHTRPERHPRGERVGTSKLSERDVREIRSRYAAGELQRSLGKAFKVHHATIGEIVRFESWKHVGS